MPKVTITGNPVVGGEIDWEFSIDGFDLARVQWSVSDHQNTDYYYDLELGNGSLILTSDDVNKFYKVKVSVLELDRNGTRILCDYTSLPVKIRSI